MSDAPMVAVLSTGLATIIFLAVLYFIYRLVRRGIALLLKGVDLQVPPIVLLVSFALAATIFTTGATNLWGIFYGLVQVLFVDLPRAIVEVSDASYACAGSGRYCLVAIGGTIANSIQRLFSRSLTYLNRVISLVQFFAAWAVLAWCIGDLLSRGETAGTAKGLRRLIADMPSTTRLRFALGGVIVIAAYLCFCAIVAVSLFKPVEKAELLDPRRLEDRLNQARLLDSDEKKSFSLRFPEELGNFPEDREEQGLAAVYSVLTDLWKQQRGRVGAEQIVLFSDRLPPTGSRISTAWVHANKRTTFSRLMNESSLRSQGCLQISTIVVGQSCGSESRVAAVLDVPRQSGRTFPQ